MAYSDPGDAVPAAVITAAWGDAVRADVVESALGIVAAKGDLAVATALNVLARLAVGADATRLVADNGEVTGVKWQIVPAARITQNANQNVGAAAYASITFNTEAGAGFYDTDGMHDNINPTRLTCVVGGDGIYSIKGNVEFDNNGGVGAQELGLRILLNNATVIAEVYDNANEDKQNISLFVSTDYELAAGDFVELQALTWNNDAIVFIANHTPIFSAMFLRGVP